MSAPHPGTLGARSPFAPAPGTQYVYLWHWALRLTHWVSAVAITVLVITGLYIGKPYFLTGGEASSHFLMGKMRLLHFIAAGWQIAAAIMRIYWLFRGNKFESWQALLLYQADSWRRLWQQVRAYLLIEPEKAPQYLGHNPLQQFFYTLLYGVAILMIATGFALYGEHDPAGFFHAAFTSWLGPLFGGIQRVRFIHHIGVWFFMVFVPVHVYLAMRMDLLEQTGTVSSIISGGRFVDPKVKYVDADGDL